MNIKHYTHCPECNGKWIGDPIPLEKWDEYSPPYFYYRLIEIWDWDKKNIIEYECPDCRLRFPLDYDPKKIDIHVWNEMKRLELMEMEKQRCGDCSV